MKPLGVRGLVFTSVLLGTLGCTLKVPDRATMWHHVPSWIDATSAGDVADPAEIPYPFEDDEALLEGGEEVATELIPGSTSPLMEKLLKPQVVP